MPDGGYHPRRPIPHDSLCDHANPSSASWEAQRLQTEASFYRKEEGKEVPELFEELCSHPWKFTEEMLESGAAQKGFTEEPIPVEEREVPTGSREAICPLSGTKVQVEEREVPTVSREVLCPWSGRSSGSK